MYLFFKHALVVVPRVHILLQLPVHVLKIVDVVVVAVMFGVQHFVDPAVVVDILHVIFTAVVGIPVLVMTVVVQLCIIAILYGKQV